MNHKFLCLVLTLAASINLSAQNPGYLNNSNETGLPNYGSFIHSDIDSINLQNGGVNIRIPLLSRKMRGFEYTVGYRYDSKFWIVDKYLSSPPLQMQWLCRG